MEKKLYIIANGGYLPGPVVEIFTMTEEGQKELEFDTWEEYEDYIINDCMDEYGQRFASAIVLTESEYAKLITAMKSIQA